MDTPLLGPSLHKQAFGLILQKSFVSWKTTIWWCLIRDPKLPLLNLVVDYSTVRNNIKQKPGKAQASKGQVELKLLQTLICPICFPSVTFKDGTGAT